MAAAVALLVGGADTPNLRILAGEDHADRRDVEEILAATLRDLGLEPLDETQSVLAVARHLASRAVGNEELASEVAPQIWRLYARYIERTWPREFARLAYQANEVAELPDEPRSTVPPFMDAARAFVATE